MAQRPFDAEAYIDAVAPLLGLEIDPAHRPGVVANLERIAAMARLVTAEPLAGTDEPAPVFEP